MSLPKGTPWFVEFLSEFSGSDALDYIHDVGYLVGELVVGVAVNSIWR
jgi:hypothetical protein